LSRVIDGGRNILAAGDRQVPDHILETVDLNFRKSPFPLWDTRLEVVRAPELLNPDLETVKAYTHQHLLSTLHIIPCFYLIFDDRTTADESALFIRRNCIAGLDETMRVMPKQTFTLFRCFAEDFERISPLTPLEHFPDINFKR
jgi:hypothetical protein